jgi:hypothetical protein
MRSKNGTSSKNGQKKNKSSSDLDSGFEGHNVAELNKRVRMSLDGLVLVFWMDAASTGEWESAETANSWRPHFISTCGYVMGCGLSGLVVCQNKDIEQSGEMVSHTMIIPHGMVYKIIRLKTGAVVRVEDLIEG